MFDELPIRMPSKIIVSLNAGLRDGDILRSGERSARGFWTAERIFRRTRGTIGREFRAFLDATINGLRNRLHTYAVTSSYEHEDGTVSIRLDYKSD